MLREKRREGGVRFAYKMSRRGNRVNGEKGLREKREEVFALLKKMSLRDNRANREMSQRVSVWVPPKK